MCYVKHVWLYWSGHCFGIFTRNQGAFDIILGLSAQAQGG